MSRETAYRIFAREFNSCTLEKKATEEKKPSYIISPLGTEINRVLVAGVLTEKENRGSDEEPYWTGRIQDTSGRFSISVGRYQSDAQREIENIDAPSYVMAVGKVKANPQEDGRVFVGLRPEHITKIEDPEYAEWLMEASRSLWDRLVMMRNALKIPDVTEAELRDKGLSKSEAEGIIMALDNYGNPESAKYLSILQEAMRRLLPDEGIDFGLPEDMNSLPDEISEEKKDSASSGEITPDKEDFILALLEELDNDSRGVSMEDLISRASTEGISAVEVEEISNNLMDKGMVYEPNLGYLKKI